MFNSPSTWVCWKDVPWKFSRPTAGLPLSCSMLFPRSAWLCPVWPSTRSPERGWPSPAETFTFSLDLRSHHALLLMPLVVTGETKKWICFYQGRMESLWRKQTILCVCVLILCFCDQCVPGVRCCPVSWGVLFLWSTYSTPFSAEELGQKRWWVRERGS